MSMTVVVTRNAEGRVRGFLASAMLEIASGVFTSPKMSPAVRERIWAVLVKWRVGNRDDGAIMTWPDPGAPGGQVVQTLGEPPCALHETPSIVLARRPLTEADQRSLTIQLLAPPF
ncbi:MAG: type I-E CRISPR-associated endoribonuclease Cas2 [Deltaproteobacteria bacterium]|nr:type I-E CRISPR-associated endoribonuclease Cas2 [Deltaproteobacteria bacterium]